MLSEKTKPQNMIRLIKVLCYLQSEEILIVLQQKQYMFAKNYRLHWIAGYRHLYTKHFVIPIRV